MAANKKPQIGKHIPDEISEEILILLQVKPLLRFRSVCKAWKTLIDSDSFKMKHLQHATNTTSVSAIFNFHRINENGGPLLKYKPSVHFLSSQLHELMPPPHTLAFFGDCISMYSSFFGFVNGLALVCWDFESFVWNPLTNEVRYIEIEEFGYIDSVITLGFDPNTKDYKVLAANFTYESPTRKTCEVKFQLYSMRSNSWKTWSRICPLVRLVAVDDAYLDGKSYWTAKECVQEDGSTVPGILVFDFRDESFEILPFIGKLSAAEDFVAVTTRGCLEILVRFGEYKYNEEIYGEIWGMEEDGSWSRKVRVVLPWCGKIPRGITKDGHMVFRSIA